MGGVSLVGIGAFASWSATANKDSGTLSAANASATLLDANGGTVTTGVADLVPGDYFYRYVDVRNDGGAAALFTGTVSTAGDLAGYLTVEAAACVLPWLTVASVSTCATPTVIGSGLPTSSTPSVAVTHGSIGAGAANAQHERYKVTFSSTAHAPRVPAASENPLHLPLCPCSKQGHGNLNRGGRVTGSARRSRVMTVLTWMRADRAAFHGTGSRHDVQHWLELDRAQGCDR